MNAELIRFVDSISRDKNIEKESVFLDLEAAIQSAIRKAYETGAEIEANIDRVSGELTAFVDGDPVDIKTLGRIAAQTAKQVWIQKIREDERSSIFDEYSSRVGTVITGNVVRYEGGAVIVNLGRGEGILPRSEQIPGEAHHPGDRIRAMILDVREEKNQVRIVLTQTHPDYIKRLFELEVPEVSEKIIEIRALAREAGYRTKVAVSSIDGKVDAVGACVGVRGSRIRNIVDELGGEKIDIVRWNESSQVLISNALKPAEVLETFLCFELGRATVVVADDQLSLAIGKRGQNVRLAARLTGWDIDILTPVEHNKALDDMERVLKEIEGVEDVLLDKLLAIGVISLHDIGDVGAEALVTTLEVEEELASHIVEIASEAAKVISQESEAAKLKAAEAESTTDSIDQSTPEELDEATASLSATTEPTGDLKIPAAENSDHTPANGPFSSSEESTEAFGKETSKEPTSSIEESPAPGDAVNSPADGLIAGGADDGIDGEENGSEKASVDTQTTEEIRGETS